MILSIPNSVFWFLVILCSGLSFLLLVMATGEKLPSPGSEPSAVLSEGYWWYVLGAMSWALGSIIILKYGLENGRPILQSRDWDSWWGSLLAGVMLTMFGSYVSPTVPGRSPLDGLLVMVGVHLLVLGFVESTSRLFGKSN
jgi:hypothetical protein